MLTICRTKLTCGKQSSPSSSSPFWSWSPSLQTRDTSTSSSVRSICLFAHSLHNKWHEPWMWKIFEQMLFAREVEMKRWSWTEIVFVSFERRENGEGYPCKNTAKTWPNMGEDVNKQILNTFLRGRRRRRRGERSSSSSVRWLVRVSWSFHSFRLLSFFLSNLSSCSLSSY